MLVAFHAQQHPERSAIESKFGSRTFKGLNERANQLAHALRRAGLGEGDAIAIVCGNRPEFGEAVHAALRIGLRFTPVNWHLTAKEMAYIIHDCDAKAILGDVRFGEPLLRALPECPNVTTPLAVGGMVQGFLDFEAVISAESGADVAEPVIGGMMLYTAGTTGHPKGVYRNPKEKRAVNTMDYLEFGAKFNRDLCTGPLYHTAPLSVSLLKFLSNGWGTVLMDKWDAEETLRLIERYGITHSHMVPTMFHRLLALPADVKQKYDISSMHFVMHGAAFCPVHVKQKMMDWFGPVLYEYYGATEGSGSFVRPEEWLQRPGTVGMPYLPGTKILDEAGNELPPGEIGYVYLATPPSGAFQYYKDDAKTGSAYTPDRKNYTFGDIGYLDEEGWLFLTDRRSDLIVSGGANIYPAEVDAALLAHPLVADACTVGIPNEEWGEEVFAAIELKPGATPSPALADEIRAFCGEHLAKFKCPRRIEFRDQLPRTDAGKILRRKVREEVRARTAS
jgi:long-chain acyl-CoA synthetase